MRALFASGILVTLALVPLSPQAGADDVVLQGTLVGEGVWTMRINGVPVPASDLSALTLEWTGYADGTIEFDYKTVTESPGSSLQLTKVLCHNGKGLMWNPGVGSLGNFFGVYPFDINPCEVSAYFPGNDLTPDVVTLVAAGYKCEIPVVLCFSYSLSGRFRVLSVTSLGAIPWAHDGALGNLVTYGYGNGGGLWRWNSNTEVRVLGNTVGVTPPGLIVPLPPLPPPFDHTAVAGADFTYSFFEKKSRFYYLYNDGLRRDIPGFSSVGPLTQVECVDGVGHANIAMIAYVGTCGFGLPGGCSQSYDLPMFLWFDSLPTDVGDSNAGLRLTANGASALRAYHEAYNGEGELAC